MPDILTTVDVMARYGCERHTAASIMRKLPFFRVGKRMFVKLNDLKTWEESLIEYPVTKTTHKTQTMKLSRRREP